MNPHPDDLKDSVRDYRNPLATDEERAGILEWWASFGIVNQFQALLKAAEL